MSKRLPTKTKKLATNKSPLTVTGEDTQDNENQGSDHAERRRIQNRLAQRNHRKKVRDHITALETRVINSMLQRPSSFNIPLSAPSNYTDQSEVYTQTFHTPEPSYEFAHEFDPYEHTYSGLSGAQSPSTSSQPSNAPNSPGNGFDGYLTPATSSISLPLTSRSNSISGPRTIGVTFDLISSFPEAQIDPSLCQMENSHTGMNRSVPTNYQKNITSSMPELESELVMRLFSKDPPISPKQSVSRYPHMTEPNLMRHFPPHAVQSATNEISVWTPEISPIDEESANSTTLSDFQQTRRQYPREFSSHQGNPYLLALAPDYDHISGSHHEQSNPTATRGKYASAREAPFEDMSIYRSPTHL